MRKLQALLALFFCAFLHLQAQPPVYINFVSHNEDNDTLRINPSLPNYMRSYSLVKELSDSIISKGVKWNYQSDYPMLTACLTHDPLAPETNGKNLILWMDETDNIECDPHSHENYYNYADIAHLYDSLGLSYRYNLGGYMYDGPMGGFADHFWTVFEEGQEGRIYDNVWQPNVLWGSGSVHGGIHGNDLVYYGCFKPTSMDNFLRHDTTKRIRAIGTGCENLLFADTDPQTIVAAIDSLINKIHANVLPAKGFYTATVMMHDRDFDSPNYIQKVCTIIDSLQKHVDNGHLIWATLSEKDSIWHHVLNERPFFLTCDSMLTYAYPPNMFPGDANNDGKCNMFDFFLTAAGYGLSGSARAENGITWAPHTAPSNWNSTTYFRGIYYNNFYLDANGDGTINLYDVAATIINRGLLH